MNSKTFVNEILSQFCDHTLLAKARRIVIELQRGGPMVMTLEMQDPTVVTTVTFSTPQEEPPQEECDGITPETWWSLSRTQRELLTPYKQFSATGGWFIPKRYQEQVKEILQS